MFTACLPKTGASNIGKKLYSQSEKSLVVWAKINFVIPYQRRFASAVLNNTS